MRLTYALFFVFSTITGLNSQVNLLNSKTVDQIGKKTANQIKVYIDEPLPYGYVDDRDILWSKTVWETIDLNQKINLPFYFPLDTTAVLSNRRSLFDSLMKGIKRGDIKDVYNDSNLLTKMTQEELSDKLSARVENGYDEETGKLNVDEYSIVSKEVSAYQIKGMWYFDKRQGELKYRLLAIAPMAIDVQSKAEGIKDLTLYTLFWVYYPTARKTLHNSKVFNPDNTMHPVSYDHLLNSRRFSSSIIKEENVYGDRAINEYTNNSIFQLLEAEKIKESIRNKEIDMWNY
jgi:gliding motility associated protien GldN